MATEIIDNSSLSKVRQNFWELMNILSCKHFLNLKLQIELPTDTITIAAKDATVEFDGIGSSSMSEQFDDDPK